jgi:glucokinase
MASSGSILGVDIGGTKVAVGLVDKAGAIGWHTRVPMAASGDAGAGLAAVRSASDQALQAHPGQVSAIGVSSPGPLDPQSGVVINPPNLPCWRNFPLGAELAAAYRLPVRVDNDANAAGLAEALWGAGAGFSSVFYATLGTGIGTGIVLDRRIFHGRTGAAAEGGHMTINYAGPKCGCGKRGCIEVLASGPAIARRALQKLQSASSRAETRSALLDLASGDLSSVTPELVVQAWQAGDPLATAVLRETVELLAIWLGNIVDLLEPEVMVIGGGLGEVMSNFFDEIAGLLPAWCINRRCREIPLKLAHYRADSGIAGAAALCLGIGEKKLVSAAL